MNRLFLYRQQIDIIDNKLIILIKKRMNFVKNIGAWKKKKNIKPLDHNRWKEVLESRISLGSKLGLKQNFIKKLYEIIHEEALKIENEL
jgi:chorismate mutase